MGYLIGEAVGWDRPRSQGGVPCCHDEDEEWNNEGLDDDTDTYLDRDGDDKELCHLSGATTVDKTCDAGGVPLCQFRDDAQCGSC
jgi:hypothetical protein